MRGRRIIGGIGVAFFLVGVHYGLARKAIGAFSPTFDEPVHLTAGYVALKTGNYRYNGYHHPPLAEMWAAIPLLWLDPIVPVQHPAWLRQRWQPAEQYQFADLFLYHNRVSAERLVRAGRFMQLLLSIILGLVLGGVGWRLYGWPAGLISLGFWSASPTFLAHGTLVSTDLAFSLFFFLFWVSLFRRKSWIGDLRTGIFLGLTLACKYFALAILPMLGVIGLLRGWRDRHSVSKKDRNFPSHFLRSAALVSGAAISVLIVVYAFGGLDIFWKGLTNIFQRSQSGRSSFFWGRHGTTGWWYYFPVVFFIKTPLPLLLGVGVVVVQAIRRKLRVPMMLWIPPLLFFFLACFSKVQIGHRHILAVYPFLILMLAAAFASLTSKTRKVFHLLPLWMIFNGFMIQPHFLSYLNECVGGSSNGYRYLSDSNVDWGQGLKLLRENLGPTEREKGIYLSYFGTADPHYYGIKYVDIGSEQLPGHKDNYGDAGIDPTTFAISVTNYQSTYYARKNVFHWLRNYPFSKLIANSILLYDFKSKPDAIARLKGLTKGR